jgi:hypothetical protein
MPFFWGLWDKGFNWDGLQRFIAGYQLPTKHCAPPGTGPTRLRQKGWLQNRGGLEENRLRGKAGARRTQEGPGVGAGVDVILVTELTSWGRSVLNVL